MMILTMGITRQAGVEQVIHALLKPRSRPSRPYSLTINCGVAKLSLARESADLLRRQGTDERRKHHIFQRDTQ